MRTAFLPIIFFILSLAACTEKIDLDLDRKDEPAVVVEGFLGDTLPGPQWIRLTRTTGYYQKGEAPPVTDAEVRVIGGGNEFDFQQNTNSDSSSYYMAPSTFELKQGKAYELEVEESDSFYTAESRMSQVPSLDSIHLRLDPFASFGNSEGEELEDTTVQVVAHFQEPPPKGDHYLFNLYIDGELHSKKANDKLVGSDESLQGDVELATLNFELSEIELGETFTLEMRSTSPECTEFYQVFSEQTELSGNPFAASPPANIPTNISGSALGFFQVSAVSSRTRTLDAQTISEIEVLGD